MSNSRQLIDTEQARTSHKCGSNDSKGHNCVRLHEVYHRDVKIYSVSLTVLCRVGPIQMDITKVTEVVFRRTDDNKVCCIAVATYCLLMIITVVIRVITNISATL